MDGTVVGYSIIDFQQLSVLLLSH